MLEIKKTGMTPQAAAELENAMAQEARNTANIEYLSMMAGIDLEEEEEGEADEQEI